MDDIDRHLALLDLQQSTAALQHFLVSAPPDLPPLEVARLLGALLQDQLSLALLMEQQIRRLRELEALSRAATGEPAGG